jgi:hypothetical protein
MVECCAIPCWGKLRTVSVDLDLSIITLEIRLGLYSDEPQESDERASSWGGTKWGEKKEGGRMTQLRQRHFTSTQHNTTITQL